MEIDLLVISVIILLILLFLKSILEDILEKYRTINLISAIFGFIILPMIAFYLYRSFPPFLPHIVVGFIQAILTLAIINYRYSQNPDLKILSFNIEPENDKQEIIAKKEFLKPVDGKRPIGEPKFRWNFCRPRRIRYIECESRPFFFRVAFDVTNLGLVGVMVHEFRYKELKPNESSQFIKSIYGSEGKERKYLRPQERITLDFHYPRNNTPLKNKKYEFSVTVYAATKSIKKTLSVDISSDLKTISWTWR